MGDTALLAPACGTAGGAVIDNWSLSEDTLGDFISFLASSHFPAPIDTSSLVLDEEEIIWNHSVFLSQSLDLSKEPQSYTKAMKQPDADAWCAAMDQERTSLRDMGAFEEVALPKGEQTIGLKWVFAYKKNAEGANILEKARVVTQGFN